MASFPGIRFASWLRVISTTFYKLGGVFSYNDSYCRIREQQETILTRDSYQTKAFRVCLILSSEQAGIPE
jgi:hypothetical protein